MSIEFYATTTYRADISIDDRAHQVVLGTRIGALEQVPRRIGAGFTEVGPWIIG